MDSGRGRAPARLRKLPSWLINQAAIPVNRLVADALASAGTRRHHYALLTTLDELGPGSQAALSDGSAVDRGDLVAAIDELVTRGLVERTPDADDRRRNVISITPAGRRQLRKLDRLVDQVQERWLDALSLEEQKELVRLLTRVVDHHAKERAQPAVVSPRK